MNALPLAAADQTADRSAEAERQFIDLWDTMSSLWGISPTMARIHGLLFVSGDSLSMDDIMTRLGISRGNVSMNLSKLLDWGLIRRAHRRGDRRDYYESLNDVWEMFTLVAAQRKRREIDPVLATLRRCRDQLSADVLGDAAKSPALKDRFERIDALLTVLLLMEKLASKFFANDRQLRAAVELLVGARAPEPDG